VRRLWRASSPASDIIINIRIPQWILLILPPPLLLHRRVRLSISGGGSSSEAPYRRRGRRVCGWGIRYPPHPTRQWLKWFCEAGGGAHLTQPGWSKPHTHSTPNNFALFRHKITLYRFNQGRAHTIAGDSNGSRGLNPPCPLTLTTATRGSRGAP